MMNSENNNENLYPARENEVQQVVIKQTSEVGYHRPGTAITSMVLGICSVSLWFYPYITSIPCLIMGIVALNLANREQGRTDPKYNGFLKAGKITGTIGIIISAVYTLFMTAIFINAFSR